MVKRDVKMKMYTLNWIWNGSTLQGGRVEKDLGTCGYEELGRLEGYLTGDGGTNPIFSFQGYGCEMIV